jgi:GNAT superfamily N-acetyltransferase
MSLQQTQAAPSAIEIRQARSRDVPTVSETLGRAFLADPVFNWIVPDEAQLRGTIAGFFRLFCKAVQPYDEIHVAAQGIGAALWVPAGRPPVVPEFEEAFTEEALALAAEYAPRLGSLMEVMEQHHPTEPHQYLWFLGVNPLWQGRGIGSALLQPVLDRLDRKSTPAYLEATSPSNRRLYERHGFDVVGVIDEHGGAPLWPMWREPRAS